MKKTGQFKDAQIYYNFLVLGYKERFYYWPFWLWLRKLAIASVIVIVDISTNRRAIRFNFEMLLFILVMNSIL
jgi:hypothetical protein